MLFHAANPILFIKGLQHLHVDGSREEFHIDALGAAAVQSRGPVHRPGFWLESNLEESLIDGYEGGEAAWPSAISRMVFSEVVRLTTDTTGAMVHSCETAANAMEAESSCSPCDWWWWA
ncbi:hypothetical protein TYRP_013838 [Tyrophagus putrescentiae]|nr:hypothetical protein TYRP_013838 [Tyrophagus putrescentiae]